MPVAVPQQYQHWVSWAAQQTGLPEPVVAAQISDESAFNPNAVSSAGAEGIAQFIPSTWAAYGHGSPFNVADAFRAYAAYMSTLLHQYHGNVRNALAAYNAGPGDLAAGYGYADTILGNAGQGIHLTAAGGLHGAGQNVQLTSFVSSAAGAVKETQALLHGIAVVLDRAFAMFAPGQGWRIVFGAAAVAAGAGSFGAFRSSAGDGEGGALFPLAILLMGAAAVGAFMAMRPWPQAAGHPIKPGAYLVDVLEGQPPPAGPQSFSAAEVDLTEAGLVALVGLWAAGKLGQAAQAGSSLLQTILGALGLGAAAKGGAGGEVPPAEAPPPEAPPIELPPAAAPL